MRKKVLSCLAVLLVFMLVFVACNKQESGNGDNTTTKSDETVVETNDTSADSGVDYIKPLGKYEPTIEVNVVKSVGAEMTVETLTENIWTDMYKNEFGIDMVYDWISVADQYNQKINLMLAGGEMPDVMQVNFRQLNMLVEAGMLTDLTGVWNATASDVTKESMRASNETPFKMATFDGKLYGIPVTTPIEETTQFLWVRTDWLKKLNLEMPTTMDELINVMKAFSEQDPDGNGIADTFGMSIAKDLYGDAYGIAGFANSYHAYPNAWVEDSNGNLVYGSIQPEMKTALAKLQEMYKLGLLDEEFIVKDMIKAGESVAQSKVGVMYGMHWTVFYGPMALWEEDNDSDFQALPLLPSDDKKVRSQIYNNTNQFLVVNKDFEHPDAAVQFFNIWNRHLRGPHVREFDEWKKYQDAMFVGSLVIPETGHWNIERYRLIDVVLEAGNGDLSIFEGRHLVKELYNMFETFETGVWDEGFNYTGVRMLYDCGEAIDVTNTIYIPEGRFLLDQLGPYTSENYIAKIAVIDQLELETFTRIITDDLPVDEFDSFVKQWKELGGEGITQEVNNWYKSMQ